MKDAPSLDGLILSAPTAPYVLDVTPALAEFQQALKTYGKNLKYFGAGTPQGWAAGKMLQAAIRNSPQTLSSQNILDGLWTIKDQELGGLVYPVTYTKDQKAPEVACWWTMQVSKGAWTAPQGTNRSCV